MPPRNDDIARWNRRGACTVSPVQAGRRLDAFLAATFPYRSRTQWARLVRKGRIVLNEGIARPGRTLNPGDRIAYVPDPRPEPRVSDRWSILYEDNSLLAIRKPANLPVHPSGRYFRNTLLLQLLESRGEDLDSTPLRIVHRLDRETSGVILFGKSREAAAGLAGQFENREVAKRYLAIVHGVPSADRFLVDGRIGRDSASPVRKAMTVIESGRPARTGVHVLRRGPEHSLIVARPYTGRLHQIRVHLRHAGHPIVGDKVYGRDPSLFVRFVSGGLSHEDRRKLFWKRQALHAWRIRLRHPESGRIITLEAPVGKAWIGAARRLGLDRDR